MAVYTRYIENPCLTHYILEGSMIMVKTFTPPVGDE